MISWPVSVQSFTANSRTPYRDFFSVYTRKNNGNSHIKMPQLLCYIGGIYTNMATGPIVQGGRPRADDPWFRPNVS